MRRRRRRFGRRTRRFTRTQSLPLERKFHDVSLVATPDIANGQSITAIWLISQGVAADQRIGNACRAVSMNARITLVKNALVGVTFNILRYWFLWDKEADGNAIVIANILDDTAIPIESPRNLNHNRRFIVLLTGTMTVSTNTPTRTRKFYKNLNLVSRYNGAGGAVGNITTGVLYLVLASDAADVVTPPSVGLATRVRFVG